MLLNLKEEQPWRNKSRGCEMVPSSFKHLQAIDLEVFLVSDCWRGAMHCIRPSEDSVQRLGDEELDIQVVGVSGDGFQVRVPKSLTCFELRRIIRDRLPLKAGARVVVMKGSQKLSLSKTLALRL